MAKILVLAKSGFGKTTSYCGREKLGIKGLDPKETLLSSVLVGVFLTLTSN